MPLSEDLRPLVDDTDAATTDPNTLSPEVRKQVEEAKEANGWLTKTPQNYRDDTVKRVTETTFDETDGC